MAAMVVILIGVTFQITHAQASDAYAGNQTTLTGEDLKNNPMAQDILEKIEETKRWIKELEQREYERLQAQKELEEKRAQALESLERDLRAWEGLWERYTFEYRIEHYRGYSDYYEFTYSKITAGREAFKKVLDDGGTIPEAVQAYHKAAEIKRIEMIEVNSQINIKYGLAYYEQQLLFNSEGQFVPTPHNLAKLYEYYTDYRLDPTYVLANPGDEFAVESTKSDPDTHCRSGYVLVHRTTSNDYTCVTGSTAQMWERYDIGRIIGQGPQDGPDENSLAPGVKTNPNTKCRQGHMVVFYLPTQDYTCVLQTTAQMLIDEGSAESHSLVTFIHNKDRLLEINNEIFDVNQKILQANKKYDTKRIELTHKYDTQYRELDAAQKKEEARIANLDPGTSTAEELSEKILRVRDSFEAKKEKILNDKGNALSAIKSEYDYEIVSLKREYRDSDEIKIVYNSNLLHYEAVKIECENLEQSRSCDRPGT